MQNLDDKEDSESDDSGVYPENPEKYIFQLKFWIFQRIGRVAKNS